MSDLFNTTLFERIIEKINYYAESALYEFKDKFVDHVYEMT